MLEHFPAKSRIPALISAFVCGLAVARDASAHPGHGREGEGYTLIHYLTEAQHIVERRWWVAAGLLSVVILVVIYRRYKRDR